MRQEKPEIDLSVSERHKGTRGIHAGKHIHEKQETLSK